MFSHMYRHLTFKFLKIVKNVEFYPLVKESLGFYCQDTCVTSYFEDIHCRCFSSWLFFSRHESGALKLISYISYETCVMQVGGASSLMLHCKYCGIESLDIIFHLRQYLWTCSLAEVVRNSSEP